MWFRLFQTKEGMKRKNQRKGGEGGGEENVPTPL